MGQYKVMFFATSNLIFHLLVGMVQELADHLLFAETGMSIMECSNTLFHTCVPWFKVVAIDETGNWGTWKLAEWMYVAV